MKNHTQILFAFLFAISTTTTGWANIHHPEKSSETATLDGGCNAHFSYFDSLCPTIDFFDGSSGAISDYAWDFGDGWTDALANPTHTYSVDGTYLVCLTVWDAFGCESTFCEPIVVNCSTPPACNADFTLIEDDCPQITFLDASTTFPGDIVSWLYDFGDGSTASTSNVTHAYTANGTYVTCLTVSTTDGCTDTHCDTVSITCVAPPSCQSFFQYTLGLCPTVAFFDASTSSPGSISSWSWDFGDGGSSSSQNPSHTYTANGLYLTCLTISTTDGCSNTYCDTINVSCITPPSCNADFQYTLGGCPDVAFFDASTASPGSVASWLWDFGDGSTSNSQNPSHIYSANGSYVTCLTITTTDSCTSTHCDTVTISCITPVTCDANFQYTLGLCPTVAFFDASTSSPGSVNSWSWSFGDGSTSNSQNPSHTYASNGSYVTCLTVSTTDSCTSTYCDTINISCITPPTCQANYQYTSANCPSISFFDASTSSPGSVINWFWDFGDGSTSSMQNPAHTYSSNGTYLTCLTIVSADSCTSTYCDTVVVSCITPPTCQANFQYTSANCPSISFFDASTSSPGSVVNWFWDFGDGSSSSMQNPSHTYSSNGTYLTCLTVYTTDSCTSSYCDTINISCIVPPSCDADFQYTAANCPSISFFDASTAAPGSIASWSWSFGDGSTSNSQNPSHTYSANGLYVTCLTISTTDSCTSTICDTINISCIVPPSCNANFLFNSTNCPSISFLDSSTASPGSIVGWAWDFGDGSASSVKNPSHTYSANGTYLTCLTIYTSDSCSSTYCDTVNISCITPPACNANFQYSGTCPEFGFTDLSTSTPDSITSWNWSFGDGTTSADQSPSHTYTSNGQYLACLTISAASGCTSTNCDTIDVTCITPVPCAAMFTFNYDSCQTVSFTDASIANSGTIDSWQWYFGDGQNSTDQNPTVVFAFGGDMIVRLDITTTDSCSSTYYDTVSVSCLPVPTCSISTSNYEPSCGTYEFQSSTFAPFFTVDNINWDFGDGISLNSYASPTHNYTANGNYLVCATMTTTYGCSATYCDTIVVSCIGSCDNPTTFSSTVLQPTKAIMSWNSIPNAVQYKLKLRETGTSAWTYINLTDTFKLKNGLNPGTDYEWKVKTICASNSPVGYGPFQYFTTPIACLNPDTFSTSGVLANQAMFNWNAVAGAVQYRVKYRVSGTGSWSYYFTATNSFTATGLNQATAYEWKVKTICVSGSPTGYGPFQYFTTAVGCHNPTGMAVSSIHETGATMSWNAVSGAVQYKVKLRPTGTSAWTYITVTDTFKVKNGLLPSTPYEWKVKTICSSGSPVSYGPLHYFTTLADPCPNPASHNTDSITWEEAWLYWNTVPNATSYKLKFREAGASGWFTTTVWAPETYKYKVGLTPSTDYEWKVKTECASGSPASYGPVQSFSTLSAESEAQNKLSATNSSFDLNVYPNPSNGQFTVDLSAAFENVSVTIRSTTGQVVYQKEFTELSSETITLEISAGLYTVEVLTEQGHSDRLRLVKN